MRSQPMTSPGEHARRRPGRDARTSGAATPLSATRVPPTRLAATLAAATLLAFGLLGPARADLCGDCGPPSRAELEKAEGFALDTRLFEFKDYVETGGRECVVEATSTPEVSVGLAWLVLRGQGEVWDCPESSSCDTMTASVAEGDVQEWSLSSTVGTKLGAFGVGVSASLTAAIRRQTSVTTVTTISKNLCATWCHRIRWWAYFLIGEMDASVDFTVKRLFSWWTKNLMTGHTVHRSGEIWVDCGSGTAFFNARMPLAAFFRLVGNICQDSDECQGRGTPKDLGWYPPLPEDVLEPPPPPGAQTGTEEDGTNDDSEAPPGGTPPGPESGVDEEPKAGEGADPAGTPQPPHPPEEAPEAGSEGGPEEGPEGSPEEPEVAGSEEDGPVHEPESGPQTPSEEEGPRAPSGEDVP